ncbi:MAG: bifunctional oligoribonuclease/PAP phosphatase NrnA [Firmicutes bacterium]|nr:bifunctional oligoribonuclease/PAP phosphatase NrnA [Bacillota bacterium]
MEHKIFQLIIDNNSIVIARHKSPDLDAYGSQFGLYYALKQQFPHKLIYVIGDSNSLNQFGEFDEIDENILSNSLVFILDTVASQMLKGVFYQKAKTLVLIDHHQNDPDIKYDYYIRDTSASSTAEMVVKFLQINNIPINKEAAKPLFMGIVGDTGRFMHNNVKPSTFRAAADLLETGLDIQAIYNSMYVESLKMKKIKADFSNSFLITKNKVAYRKNDKNFLEQYNIDSNTISRGLVNQMAGIDEIPVWVNFTFDTATNNILCEFRSRELPVLEVAKKYGGGGHLMACGCSVSTWEETDEIINDLDKLVEEQNG